MAEYKVYGADAIGHDADGRLRVSLHALRYRVRIAAEARAAEVVQQLQAKGALSAHWKPTELVVESDHEAPGFIRVLRKRGHMPVLYLYTDGYAGRMKATPAPKPLRCGPDADRIAYEDKERRQEKRIVQGIWVRACNSTVIAGLAAARRRYRDGLKEISHRPRGRDSGRKALAQAYLAEVKRVGGACRAAGKARRRAAILARDARRLRIDCQKHLETPAQAKRREGARVRAKHARERWDDRVHEALQDVPERLAILTPYFRSLLNSPTTKRDIKATEARHGGRRVRLHEYLAELIARNEDELVLRAEEEADKQLGKKLAAEYAAYRSDEDAYASEVPF